MDFLCATELAGRCLVLTELQAMERHWLWRNRGVKPGELCDTDTAHLYHKSGVKPVDQLGHWFRGRNSKGSNLKWWFPNPAVYTNNLWQLVKMQTIRPTQKFCSIQPGKRGREKIFLITYFRILKHRLETGTPWGLFQHKVPMLVYLSILQKRICKLF